MHAGFHRKLLPYQVRQPTLASPLPGINQRGKPDGLAETHLIFTFARSCASLYMSRRCCIRSRQSHQPNRRTSSETTIELHISSCADDRQRGDLETEKLHNRNNCMEVGSSCAVLLELVRIKLPPVMFLPPRRQALRLRICWAREVSGASLRQRNDLPSLDHWLRPRSHVCAAARRVALFSRKRPEDRASSSRERSTCRLSHHR